MIFMQPPNQQPMMPLAHGAPVPVQVAMEYTGMVLALSRMQMGCDSTDAVDNEAVAKALGRASVLLGNYFDAASSELRQAHAGLRGTPR